MIDQEQHLKQLMLQGLAGDAASARELLITVRAHLRAYYLRRLAGNTAEAEDLAQECLLAIHAKRRTFDPELSFSAWAYAIARYKLTDHLRRRTRERTVALDSETSGATVDFIEPLAARSDLARALAILPAPQRQLLTDVRITGLSVSEAAARHGLSPGAAKVSVHRSLKKLTTWATSNDR